MNRDVILKIAALVAIVLAGCYLFYHFDLHSLFLSRKKLTEFVSSFGPLSVVIFIGLQILQVLIAPIPGEITGFIGGYLYGPVLGTLYSTVGLAIGSWLAFMMARLLGLPFVERVLPSRIIQKYDYFMEHRGIPVTFILFLVPGFPKDALSYIVGLSHMKTTTFLILCSAGRLFGTVGLSVSGAYARNDQHSAMLVILALSIVVAFLAWYYHEPLLNLLRKKSSP